MNSVDFGFQKVSREEKAQKVNQVFSSVASRYDIMNDLMSFGLHRIWKRQAISACAVQPADRVLDLACGSCDLAIQFTKYTASSTQIYAVDCNPEMLEQGRSKAYDLGISGIQFCLADAQCLPYSEGYFSCVVMAFGLRNVVDIDRALREIYRVLKPGGRIVILEFSTPIASDTVSGAFKKGYDWYSFNILPRLGSWIAQDSASYQYLAESIRKHPDQEQLKSQIERSGFSGCQYQNRLSGIVAIHKAFKIV